VFADGSQLDQAGISRALVDTGDRTTDLDFNHNGKFLYFYGSNGNSTVRVPQNYAKAFPVGYTVTLILDDFNGNSVYVNSGGDTSNDLHISAVGFSASYWNNNDWRIGGTGNAEIYTLMKVNNNRWVLSGPSIYDNW